jgi:hypothetical protein
MAREDFQKQSRTSYDSGRLILSSHRLDAAGTPVPVPDKTFSHLLADAVQEPDSEVAQVALSSDAPKLYGFGRAHRVFTIQGKILDSDLDKTIAPSDRFNEYNNNWNGHSFTDLQDFYNEYGSLAVCAKQRRVVRMLYARRGLYGAINALNVSTTSGQPNCYDVSMSFFVTREFV